jgi:predicted acylesterase/phospholipase RssA
MIRGLILLSLAALDLGAQERLVLEVRPPDHRFRFLPELKAPGQRPLVLALRGGSAKGLAHAGLLRRLEEEGWHPEGLVGTSAGSLASALFACGLGGAGSERVFAGRDFSAVLDDRRRAPGLSLSEDEDLHGTVISLAFARGRLVLVPGEERARRLRITLVETLARGEALGDGRFDHLGTRLRVVASSLTRGEARVLDHGSLVDAVKASMSIPGLLAPVVIDGEHLVDGGLVENMPVLAGREAFPGAVVVGVNIGRTWDASEPTDILALVGRSLDLAMRVTEARSEAAADGVLRPKTDEVAEFDYRGQEGVLFEAGAKALEAGLPALERQLMPGSEAPAAAALQVEGPIHPDLATLLPSGPLTRADLWRLLRRLHRRLPVGAAWVQLPAAPTGTAVLHWETAAPITQVELTLPPGWSEPSREAVRRRLEELGLVPGRPFHAAAFGRLEQELVASGVLRGASVLDLQGSGFVAGTLRLVVREPIIAKVEVTPGRHQAGIEALMKPVEGRIVRAPELEDRLARSRDRLGLRRVETTLAQTPEGLVLHLRPVPGQPTVLNATLAYESDWGLHGGLVLQGRNLFGTGVGGSLEAEADSLQKRLGAHVAWTPARLPGLAFGAFGTYVSQDVRGGLLFLPSSAAYGLGFTRRELGLEAQLRWGSEDRGRVGLAALEQRGTFTVLGARADMPRAKVFRAWAEWDDFDFHSLPTRGTLLRLSADRSFQQEPDRPVYDRLYLRASRQQPLGWGWGLKAEVEAALERNAPPDRWWVAGGSDSFIGTRSAAYLLPNVAALKLGLPYTQGSLFGVGWQAGPRIDVGRAAAEPGGLRRGLKLEGYGFVARTVVRDFFLEVSAGRVALFEGAFRERESRIAVLFGARPFDPWKRK